MGWKSSARRWGLVLSLIHIFNVCEDNFLAGGDAGGVEDVVEPDGRQLDRVLLAVVQLLGEGCFRPQRRGQAVDQRGVSRQDAVGCGVGQRRQGDAAPPAVVVGAEDEHQVGGQDCRRGPPPDAGVDGAAALIVDVG